MGELVNVTVADHLATIRLDRPPMNAVNTRMQVELSEAAAYVGRVPQFRAAVVYGGPKVFAGGADVKEMADKAHLDAGVHPAFTGGFHRRRRDPQACCGRDHRIRARRRPRTRTVRRFPGVR